MDDHEGEWHRKNLRLGDDWKVDDIKYITTPMKVKIYVSFIGEAKCPICNSRCPKYDTRKREWRDVDYGRARCDIVASIPRISCKTCGIREIKVSWAGIASNLTKGLEKSILEMAKSSSIKGSATYHRVDEKTCWRILRTYTDIIVSYLDLYGMEIVLIDETSSEKGHRYISNVIDHRSGCVVFSTEGNDSSVLHAFRYWLIHHNCDPNGIKVICCDMSRAFIAGANEAFPNASLCFDKFHVIQHANLMVDNVRRKTGIKSRKAKGLRYGFTMNKEDLAEKNEEYQQKIRETLDTYADLGRAYAIKEALRDFYDLDKPEHAAYFLRCLMIYCQRDTEEEIVSLGNMIKSHFDGILFWYSCKVSNGMAEGRNSVIQAMKCTSRGFKDVDNLIAMIQLRSTLKHPSIASNSLLPGI